MAGRRQHFIPRKFLRPFCNDSERSTIWLFRRGAERAVNTTIMNVAHQRDFYSPPESKNYITLDDEITEYESSVLYPMLDELRSDHGAQELNESKIAEVIVHLSIRTAHTRTIFREGTGALTEAIKQLLENPNILLGSEGFPSSEPSTRIKKLISDAIDEQGLSKATGFSTETLTRLAYMLLRENSQELRTLFSSQRSSIEQAIDKFGLKRVPDFHKEALSGSLAPPARVEQLSKFYWCQIPTENALLPDCVCVARDKVGHWLPLLLSNPEEIEVIVMPLSPNKLAVGKKEINTEFNHDEFNTIAVKTSYDFCLCKENNEKVRNLYLEYGHNSEKEINEYFQKSINGALYSFLENPNSNQAKESILDHNTESDAGSCNINFQFDDTIESDQHKLIVDSITQLIQNVCVRSGSKIEKFCHYINCIIITDDYLGTINSLTNNKTRGTEDDNNIGIAIPIITEYKKIDLVLRHSAINQLYAATNTSTRNYIKITLEEIFLWVVYFSKIQSGNKITRDKTTFIETNLSQLGNEIYYHFFKHKYGTFSLEYLHTCEKITIEKLDEYRNIAISKRNEYRNAGDVNIFYIDISHLIRDTCQYISKLIGLYNNEHLSGAVSEKLNQKLIFYELDKWYSLLEKDLTNFDRRTNVDWNTNELSFQNRHAERLLLWFGILLDETESGMYIHVPYIIGLDE
ncbi:DUF4238 domain-containing protein [uncultured Martelella sp.]|uniref:DUF4238 domain-containing protein n=1 Tax=uncultured Martelella sp. TaxID=392331 RepID=UPI0029C7C49C|nr:DUF4238 domain-containing protein [uncultured Martelella sp.]